LSKSLLVLFFKKELLPCYADVLISTQVGISFGPTEKYCPASNGSLERSGVDDHMLLNRLFPLQRPKEFCKRKEAVLF
jgi:hypothetical protein